MKIITLFLILILCLNSFAQSPYKDPTWTLDGGLLLGTVGLKAIASMTEKNVKTLSIEQVNDLNKNDLNWLDKGAASQNSEFARNSTGVVTISSFIVPAFLFTSSKVRSDWGRFSLMYLETFELSAALTDVVKNMAQRIRPYVYNPEYPIKGYDDLEFDDKIDNKDANKSFFSSDVSLAFALATFTSVVYNDYYPDSKMKPYIQVGTYAYASFVAYLRYASGWHYPTDIIAAALVGSSIGYLVPYIHRNEKISIGTSYRPENNAPMFNLSLHF